VEDLGTITGPPQTAAAERDDWVLIVVCVIAGALSVRFDTLGTPLAAAGAGLLGLIGLRLYDWSRLPTFTLTYGRPDEQPSVSGALLWFVVGLVVGLSILAVIRGVIEPSIPAIGKRIEAAGELSVWRRLVIIYVAAVTEELIFRLVMLSAIVGVAIRALRRTTLVPTHDIVWAANAASAVAFAGVHLPSWGAAASDPWLAVSVFVLNLVVGLVLGYVFVTRGIAAAMWTHAGGDCGIQLVGPLSR
jgi:hypothetical protein